MVRDLVSTIVDRLQQVLLSPGSTLSLWSLVAALLLAAGVVLAARRGRPVAIRTMARALFPRRWRWGPSARADIAFTLFAVFLSAVLLGGAIFSHVRIAASVTQLLGPRPALGIGPGLALATMTLALWLAYEFAYWFDHLLSHKVPALWAFHKVHHSAETLSPLTVFRVHPVDSIVFYNIVALATGVTAGVMRWLVGAGVAPMTIAGTNVLLVVSLFTIKHLHHSHAWIAWRGNWGRLILSPAHHQIHHSVAREHHDRNFGETLAVFDWLAGTLHQPQTKREPLRFGVEGLRDPHTVHGSLVAPFFAALSPLWPRMASDDVPIPALPASTPDIRPATN